MSLVVFSGFVGLMAAPGTIHPLIGFVAILCIAVSAGGSAAVNMWYDGHRRDHDAHAPPPLPQGRIEPQAALEFGTTLIFASVLLMALASMCWLRFCLRKHPLFTFRLYDLAQAPHAIQYRDRRRCRCISTRDRVGGGNGPYRPSCLDPVRHHLFLDAAAFLGAGALPQRRLPRRGVRCCR